VIGLSIYDLEAPAILFLFVMAVRWLDKKINWRLYEEKKGSQRRSKSVVTTIVYLVYKLS
jgi:hypothetical protein